jgi:hypothetical protein
MPLFRVSGSILSVSFVELVPKVPARPVKPAPEFPLSVPVASWAAKFCYSAPVCKADALSSRQRRGLLFQGFRTKGMPNKSSVRSCLRFR